MGDLLVGGYDLVAAVAFGGVEALVGEFYHGFGIDGKVVFGLRCDAAADGDLDFQIA